MATTLPRFYHTFRRHTTMSRQFGRTIVQNAKGQHSATVIALHGLGDTGNGWSFLGGEMSLDHVKYLYPTAPTRPITLNGGMPMPGWFDLDTLDNTDRMLSGGLDHDGISASVDYVRGLVEDEVKAGVAADRVLLLGFSQGGHIALKSALTYPGSLAGCVALSTWLDQTITEVDEGKKRMPFFVGHGEEDPLVSVDLGKATNKRLAELGVQSVTFKTYGRMGHSACPDELSDIKDFLEQAIPATPAKKPTAEEVGSMSVRALKEFLASNGVDSRGLFEKSDLIEKAKSLL